MRKLALLALVLAGAAYAGDLLFRTDNVTRGPVQSINLLLDGGLTGHRDAGSVAHLECAIATASTRGCVEPTDQSWTGPKRITGGTQDVCVTHANLTACSSPNAGLHQCCSTHANAQVWCDGTTNVELTGSSSSLALAPVYVNGLFHSGAGVLASVNLPFGYVVTAVSGYIGAGTGAGSVNLRFTDGANLCDCPVDCDTDQYTLTCSGNCTFAAATQVIVLPNSDTCTTPPTIKGLIVPTGYRT